MRTIAYEAHCACGARWRVYADERVEDPKGTCLGCGADTYDLRSISNGGPDAKWSPFDGDVDAAGA